jgi:hypothetical protein
MDTSYAIGLQMAMDQLNLEILVGNFLFAENESGGMMLVPSFVDSSGLLAAAIGFADIGSYGGAGVGMGGCPAPCRSMVPGEMWEGPTSQAEARQLKGQGPAGMELHHTVSQNVGNITKFGLLSIHDPGNTAWLSAAQHKVISNWQSSSSGMYGITNGNLETTGSFSDQFALGSWFLTNPPT